jgi:alanine racemase
VEINTAHLAKNLAYAKQASGCEIMAVVKAGAYGHGLEEISKILERNGVAFLGVANIGEARRIREAGVRTAIYLLGATWEGEREEIVARDVTPCISTVAEARAFDEIAKRHSTVLAVHLAVDTGMGRGGFLPDEFTLKAEELKHFQYIRIEGIASHLSSSDEDEDFTRQQIAAFENAVKQTGGVNFFKWRHLSNSGGILGYPAGCCNLARPGLMLYGISPFPADQEKLYNVMTLKSRVTLVRTLPAGHSISYGRSFITTRPTRVATIGIGYGDGYPRHVSGKGAEVYIRGQRHPLIGRVTMDQIIIALPDDSDISSGDEVELFGANIAASEVAQWADTIAWEVFTGITPRVQRVYIGS